MLHLAQPRRGSTWRHTIWLPLIAMMGACTGPPLSGLSGSVSATSQDGPVATSLTAVQQEALPSAALPGSKAERAPPSAKTTGILAEARALRRSGEKKKAFERIEAAMAEAAPADHTLLVESGLLALEIGNLDKAERYLKQANDPAGSDWRVLSGLGVAASSQGRPEDARRYFKAALMISPGQPAVLNNLAMASVLERKTGEAERMLRDAAKAAPQSDRIKQNLALAQGLKARERVPDDVSPPAFDGQPGSAPAARTPPRRAASAALPAGPMSQTRGPVIAGVDDRGASAWIDTASAARLAQSWPAQDVAGGD